MQMMGIYSSDIVFPKLEPLITKGLWMERRRLLKDVRGNVLEFGPGAGENFKFISPGIRSYTAIDPSNVFINKAHQKSQLLKKTMTIKVIRAKGDNLPFKSDSFDAVICFFVLWSANDISRSLSEIYRVLNPGGKLLFFEHVFSEHQAMARLQHRGNSLRSIIGCGCELNRNTMHFVKEAGFDFIRLHQYRSPCIEFGLTSEVIEGAAVKSVVD
jgi:ubiquinone/menaquinone biosynthesis C-methylase UbiE